jgi:hypothetical protein
MRARCSPGTRPARCPAHDDIGCGETGFRPGVDRDMRFGQQQPARSAATLAEGIEKTGQNMGAGSQRGLSQQGIQSGGIAQPGWVHAVQVGQQISPTG